jgi:hypothetical protein
MFSSGVAVLGHQHIYDNRGDGPMEHRSKRRNSRTSDHHHPTDMIFEFAPSVSPSSSSITDFDDGDAARLPKRISIMNNIIRPIPKRVSSQFYDEAYRKGLTLQETNQAAIMAHDWHRKWTHQDEANHTMPEQDFYQSTAAGIPDSYGYNKVFDEHQGAEYVSDSDIGVDADHQFLCLEREGARNPSLESYLEDSEKMRSVKTVHPTPKRHHFAINDRLQQRANSGSTQSQLKGFHEHEPKLDYNYEGIFRVSSTESSTSMDSYRYENPSSHQVKRVFTGFDKNTNHIERPEEEIVFQTDDESSGDESYESHHEYGDGDDEEEPRYGKPTYLIQRPLPIRPVVVKPVAIHANRPEYVLPQPTNGRLLPFVHGGRNGNIPRDIVTDQFDRAEIVSPIRYSQLSCQSSLENELIGMTVLETDQQDCLHLVEDYEEDLPTDNDHETDIISTPIANNIEKARDDMLHNLAISDGDVESKDFETKLDPLQAYFLGKEVDTRSMSHHQLPDSVQTSVSRASVANSVEGTWLTLSKPNWFGKLGENDNGDPLYTLGRMSFDMFSPTNLICSIQGNFNRINIVSGEDRKAMLEAVPKKLREEVESGKTALRTYHIVTAFTIEPSMAAFPDAPNKDVIHPIRGIITTYGYSLPDPETPNRHSVWFTGGRIEPNNDMSDILPWKNLFTLHPPIHSFGEKAKLLAVKLLMGATIPEEVDPEDGSMNYVFTRPLGGHGMAYVDVLYMDESLRIVKGQRGTTYVFSRVPDI